MPTPKSKPNLNINLLFPQGLPQKLPIRFLKWLISYGRYMAIIVEVIVVATFLIRFKLDADLNSLNDQINSQVPYIESLNADESLVKQTQFKLSTFKTIDSSSPDITSTLNSISSQMTTGTVLSNINLDNSDPKSGFQFRVVGIASTPQDLEIFLAGLKQQQNLKGVTLTSIGFQQDQLNFSIGGEVINQ